MENLTHCKWSYFHLQPGFMTFEFIVSNTSLSTVLLRIPPYVCPLLLFVLRDFNFLSNFVTPVFFGF